MGRDLGVNVAELFEGIYRIELPTPYPVGPVNLYLFQDADAFDLIDTGSPTEESLSVLETALASLGLGTSRLRNIFLTHGHLDHAGALTALMEKFGAAAFSGAADIPIIEANVHETFWSRKDAILGTYRRIGFPDSALQLLPSYFISMIFRTPPAGSVTALRGGELIKAGRVLLEALAVPGHTPGSLCFYLEAERALFSGDTLLGNVTPNPGTILYHEILESDRIRSNPLRDFLASLGRLARIEAVVAFPGHGPQIADPGGLINDYLLHHQKRLASILAILDGRDLSCFEISKILFKGSRDIGELVLQNIEVLAHMIYFVRERSVVELVSDDGITRYSRDPGQLHQCEVGS
jgi:glyoxylase-like metal-dependent hydrolase (beta-lactamase superfamily II)